MQPDILLLLLASRFKKEITQNEVQDIKLHSIALAPISTHHCALHCIAYSSCCKHIPSFGLLSSNDHRDRDYGVKSSTPEIGLGWSRATPSASRPVPQASVPTKFAILVRKESR